MDNQQTSNPNILENFYLRYKKEKRKGKLLFLWYAFYNSGCQLKKKWKSHSLTKKPHNLLINQNCILSLLFLSLYSLSFVKLPILKKVFVSKYLFFTI